MDGEVWEEEDWEVVHPHAIFRAGVAVVSLLQEEARRQCGNG